MAEYPTTPFPDRMVLAGMIETAGGPSRLLDCHVWLIVGPVLGSPFRPRGHTPILPSEIVQGRWLGSALEKYPDDVEGIAGNWRVPEFTRSLDAAKTIMANVGYVLWRPIGKTPHVSTQTDDGWSEFSRGANEAMALSAAGLRAGGPVFHDVAT